jgi:hypothetical protein
MNQDQQAMENVWDKLLSRDTKQVLEIFATLDEIEQQAVLDHLRRMVQEPGWHPEQRLSAQTALKALGS